MKRLFFTVGFLAAAVLFAVLYGSSPRLVDAAGLEKKFNKVVAGEIAIDADCPVGHLAHGEVTFPRELPKVPLIFLMENRHPGAFVVFKADEVTTKGFKWAGCEVWGDEKYKTNLAWLAVLPD